MPATRTPPKPRTGSPPSSAERSRRRRSAAPLLAAPSGLLYLGFFLLPLLVIGLFSLGRPAPPMAGGLPVDLSAPSLHRYGDVFDPLFVDTLWSTFRVAVTGTLLCAAVGFPVAYVLATRVSARWRTILLVALMVPFWTSYLLRTFAWRIILAPEGPVSHLLGTPIEILDTRTAVQIGVVYNYLPLAVLPMFVALDRIDPSLRQASKDLGAGRLATLWHVTLPLALPGIAVALMLLFIPLSGDYVTASILGGGRGIMAGNLLADQFGIAQNWALGSAMAIVLIALVAGCILVVGLLAVLIRALVRRRVIA